MKKVDSSSPSARRSCLVSPSIDPSYNSILGECARDGRLAHHGVLPRFFAVEEWPSRRDFTVMAGLLHRVHRVATATFWRTFQHDGKLTQAGEGGGCTPPPFHYIYHHVQGCGVPYGYEGRYTPPFLLYPYMYSVVCTAYTLADLSPNLQR
jgi:hypothetical protein